MFSTIWDGIVQLGSWIITPLYDLTSLILIGFHWLFSPVFGADSGWSWALSIVGLTVVIRILLIPLFVKQIRASRNLALLQPKVRDLQKKYKHDRQKLTEETMKLYKETGTNPFASCLPILLQIPIFLALFRLLDGAARGIARGHFIGGTPSEANAPYYDLLAQSQVFGARIADRFIDGGSINVTIVTLSLVALMTITTFTTQRQLMRKNMPPEALTGPYAQQQKMLLIVLPVVFAVGGVAFPIGVLLYWTTSNMWTMGQQFYVIRRNPAPGTPAFKALEQRREAKHGRHGSQGAAADADESTGSPNGSPNLTKGTAANGAPTRQQPKKQPRSQRTQGGGQRAQGQAGKGQRSQGQRSQGQRGNAGQGSAKNKAAQRNQAAQRNKPARDTAKRSPSR